MIIISGVTSRSQWFHLGAQACHLKLSDFENTYSQQPLLSLSNGKCVLQKPARNTACVTVLPATCVTPGAGVNCNQPWTRPESNSFWWGQYPQEWQYIGSISSFNNCSILNDFGKMWGQSSAPSIGGGSASCWGLGVWESRLLASVQMGETQLILQMKWKLHLRGH